MNCFWISYFIYEISLNIVILSTDVKNEVLRMEEETHSRFLQKGRVTVTLSTSQDLLGGNYHSMQKNLIKISKEKLSL
jgi:hypothetical protein